MKKILYTAFYFCSALLLSSCIGDLDQYPHEDETSSIGGAWRFSGLAAIYHLQRMLGWCVFSNTGSSFWNRLICGDTCT